MPGRAGLLITIYLITENVYGSTEAPPDRGLSYIEIWTIGIQFPMLLALLEYSYIIALKRFNKKKPNLTEIAKNIDIITLIISITFFFFFNIFYWIMCYGILY